MNGEGVNMPRKGQKSKSVSDSLRGLWKDYFYRKQMSEARKKAIDEQMRERVKSIERALEEFEKRRAKK